VTCDATVAERLGIRLVPEPGAEAMLILVTRRMAEGAWSDVATVDANYLRRTDAELLKDKVR
jgi:tRNA threonylcarbamoyladenosine biosynthesis protein TsaB